MSLRQRLAKVKEWEERKRGIDEELAKVWVEGGEALGEPTYTEGKAEKDDVSNTDEEI